MHAMDDFNVYQLWPVLMPFRMFTSLWYYFKFLNLCWLCIRFSGLKHKISWERTHVVGQVMVNSWVFMASTGSYDPQLLPWCAGLPQIQCAFYRRAHRPGFKNEPLRTSRLYLRVHVEQGRQNNETIVLNINTTCICFWYTTNIYHPLTILSVCIWK